MTCSMWVCWDSLTTWRRNTKFWQRGWAFLLWPVHNFPWSSPSVQAEFGEQCWTLCPADNPRGSVCYRLWAFCCKWSPNSSVNLVHFSRHIFVRDWKTWLLYGCMRRSVTFAVARTCSTNVFLAPVLVFEPALDCDNRICLQKSYHNSNFQLCR